MHPIHHLQFVNPRQRQFLDARRRALWSDGRRWESPRRAAGARKRSSRPLNNPPKSPLKPLIFQHQTTPSPVERPSRTTLKNPYRAGNSADSVRHVARYAAIFSTMSGCCTATLFFPPDVLVQVTKLNRSIE